VPLVRRAALASLEADANPVIVVLGANNHEILPALENLPNVRIALNMRWEQGLSSSLSAGFGALADNPEVDGALILLADQPFVDSHTLRALVDAFGDQRLVASAYSETIGVPALIGREYFDDLSHLQGDRGAGRWLRSRIAEVRAVPLSAPPLDIDTLEDVAQMRALD
jgi:molybdenum cofactor cytidylyltransferase